jgi:hypothetical protein
MLRRALKLRRRVRTSELAGMLRMCNDTRDLEYCQETSEFNRRRVENTEDGVRIYKHPVAYSSLGLPHYGGSFYEVIWRWVDPCAKLSFGVLKLPTPSEHGCSFWLRWKLHEDLVYVSSDFSGHAYVENMSGPRIESGRTKI